MRENRHSLAFDPPFQVGIVDEDQTDGIVFVLDLSKIFHCQVSVTLCELSALVRVYQKVHCLHAFLITIA